MTQTIGALVEEQATEKASTAETAQETGAAQDADAKEKTGARRSSRAAGAKKETTGTRQSSGTKRQAGGRRSSGGGRSGAKAGQEAPAGTDHQEVEWQFDADDLERVEGWIGERTSGPGLVVGSGSTDELVDAYYDTEDWRLYRAGYALRARKAGSGVEATMKSLAPAEGNLRRRREISEPLGDDEIETLREAPGPVGVRLGALVGGREVRKLFEIRTRRQTFSLESGCDAEGSPETGSSSGEAGQDAPGDVRGASSGGGRVGEIVLDSSEIPLGDGGESARLTRVEVEVGAEAASDPGVRGLVGELGEALGLRPARISKYEAGLFATGLSPEGPDDLGPTEVGASNSLGEMAFAVLRRQFAIMRSHEAGTRLGEDPEELHDMRVATRRMRAAMRLFEDALPERARWLREELRWIAGSLGDVRDLDVQMEQVEGWAADADEEGSEAFAGITSALTERREAARKRMLEALDSDRYKRFETSFAEMLRRGPSGMGAANSANGSSEAAGTPVLKAAPDLLAGRYRRWRKAAGRLNEGSRPEEYHDLRKKGKRLRYALEFFSGVYGGEVVGALVKPLKAVQESLGQHQDAIVTSDLLREIVGESPKLPPRTAFAMGLLAQRRLGEAAGIRDALPGTKEYRVLTGGKAWRRFEKIMEKERRGDGKPGKGPRGSGKGKKKGR